MKNFTGAKGILSANIQSRPDVDGFIYFSGARGGAALRGCRAPCGLSIGERDRAKRGEL